jgi:hypothetical protein
MVNLTRWSIYILIIAMSALAVPIGSLMAEDRIELDDTAIIGSRELPKVTYIVPWKSSRIGELGDMGDVGSFEDGMSALDRDLFRKELEYFGMLHGAGRQTQQ